MCSQTPKATKSALLRTAKAPRGSGGNTQDRVRPSGFEPETCGIERSDFEDEEVSVKGQFRYPFV